MEVSLWRWESSSRRSDQPQPLVRQRMSGNLIEIGGMNTSRGDKIYMVIGEMNYLSKVGCDLKELRSLKMLDQNQNCDHNRYWRRDSFG